MSSEGQSCEICSVAEFRYTCPKCNIRYCSVECYRSSRHLKCSEQFYKDCIREELSSTEPSSKEDMKRMYEILKRIRESDAGIEGIDFADPLDSDDDEPDRTEHIDEEVDGEEELANRLQGVNLNDAEEIWNRLNEAERFEFQKMIDSGDIVKLIPDFKPWWIQPKPSKIVEIGTNPEAICKGMPVLAENIPRFSDLCKKQPSPCVHYNIWNILSAYACVVRFFEGEHLSIPDEAVAHLVNLSATLKYGTNFENTEDAIISVEMEALTTRNGASVGNLYVESREQLKDDARQLMLTPKSKLLALSDILKLFQLVRARKNNPKVERNDFHKLFAVCNGSVELTRAKIKHLQKKIEFFLAYINRDYGIHSTDKSSSYKKDSLKSEQKLEY